MFGIANTLLGKISLTIAVVIAGALAFYEGVHETPEVPAVTVAPEDNVGAPSSGTIDRLDQWTSTTSPTLAITQRTWGKDIKLTGYESLTCLGTDANGYLGAGTCGGGGAGSGTVSTSTPLVNTQVTYATGVSTIGSDAGFTYDSSTDRFNVVTASSTFASTTQLTLGGDFITDINGNGLTLTSGVLTATLGTTIAANEMASADFGSFTCNGTSCTIDSQAVSASMLANADFGNFTVSGGVATIDNGSVTNAMLANSTISGIALGSNLANLSATDSTLTFSGTYTGATARTIGINLANANSWSALQTFANASTTGYHSFGSASSTNWLNITADCDADNQALGYDITTAKFVCGDDDNSGGGGGSGTVSTSSSETATQVPFWTSTAATPALLSGGSSSFVWDNTLLKLTVANASTTRFSALTEAKFGATATSSFNSAGALTLASALAAGSGGTGVTSFGGTDTILYTTAASVLASEAAFTYNQSTNLLGADNVTVTTNLELNGAGVRASGADGVLTLLGIGNGNDENLTWDFDNGTANSVVVNTGTGVTDINWSAINLFTTGRGGFGTTTPQSQLAAQGIAGSLIPIFSAASSSLQTYFSVLQTGTTTVSGPSAASSTPYIYSTAAGKGGGFIVEDVDGAGCTEITTLNGVISAQIVTCPTEI